MASIKYTDLLSADIRKNITELKKELKEIDGIMRGLPKIDFQIKGGGKELKEQEKALKEILKVEKQLISTKTNIDKENQRIAKEEEKRNKKAVADAKRLQKQRDNNAKALNNQRQKALTAIRKEEFAEEQLQKTLKKVVKSQKDLREQTNALKKVRDRLDTSTAKGRKEWDKYTASILRNNKALIKNDEQIDQHQRKVGKYENAFNKVGAGLKNIGGALGITAGITALVTAFDFLTTKGTELLTNQKVLATQFGITGSELRNLTADMNAVANAFNQDITELQKVTNTVAKEFGISGAEALSLIEQGFKTGSNNSGEFLSILGEYPAQFKQAGIDAKTSFAIINQQVKEGIYSDKGVDAIKEGGLRLRENTKAVQDALAPLDESIKKQIEQEIASGNSFKAIQLVSGALKDSSLTANETQAIIAGVFGGAGEDAGLRYLKTLSDIDTSLDGVKNQTGTVKDATLEFNKTFNKLILEATNGVSVFGKFISQIIDFGTEILNSVLNGNALTDFFKELGTEFSGLFTAFGKIIDLFKGLGGEVDFVSVVFKVLSTTLKTALIPIRLIISGLTTLFNIISFVANTFISFVSIVKDFALSFDFVNTAVQFTVDKFGLLKDAFIGFLEVVGILDKELAPNIEALKETGKETENLAVSANDATAEEAKLTAELKANAEQLEKNKKATEDYNNTLDSLRDKSKSVYESLVTDVFEKNEIGRANELEALENSLSDLSANQIKKIKKTDEYRNAQNAINLKFDTEEQKLLRAKSDANIAELNRLNKERIKQSNDDFKNLQKVNAQNFRAEIIELKKSGADKDEIAIKEKEFKIVQLQNYLDFVRQNNSDLTEEQKKGLANTISELELELENFKNKETDKEGISSIIAKRLGLTEEGLNAIVSAGADLVSELGSVIDDNLAKQSEALETEKTLSDERIELLANELEAFESTKSEEQEAIEKELETEQDRINRLQELGVAFTDDKLVQLQTELANQQSIDAQKDVIKQAQIAKDLADEKAKNALIEAEQKKVAEKQKKLALARSVINTAVAVGNALATVPFPANLVVAGLVGAKGVLEYRKIQAQEFEHGTESVQRKGAKSGIDTVPAMLTENERVVPVKDNVRIPKNFKNSQIPEAVNHYLNRGNEQRQIAPNNYFGVLSNIDKNTKGKSNINQVFDKFGNLISETKGNVTNRYN